MKLLLVPPADPHAGEVTVVCPHTTRTHSHHTGYRFLTFNPVTAQKIVIDQNSIAHCPTIVQRLDISPFIRTWTSNGNLLTTRLIEPGGSMPHSQGISSNLHPEFFFFRSQLYCVTLETIWRNEGAL